MKQPQLFLLHFAGGNRYSFHFLQPYLKHFQVISPELPGRGRRLEEALLTHFDDAAADIADQVMRQIHAPEFVIYGHSLGAYMALRVANMLEGIGKMPAAVITSGNAGPGLSDKTGKKRYLLPRDEFIAELKSLGGVSQELLEHEELFGFFEPILRADFQLAERNGLENEPPVKAPLFAVMGTGEEDAEKIHNWSRFTQSGFQSQLLPGGHFFIHDHPAALAKIISNSYERATAIRVT